VPSSFLNSSTRICIGPLSARHDSAVPALAATGSERPLIAPPLPLALWHLLSLDAPTVAVVWTLAFASVTNVHLPGWIPVLIALSAWSAYIGDRLLDARAGLATDPQATTAAAQKLRQRHYFHWRHRRTFIPIAVAAAGIAAFIVFLFMPSAALTRNTVLGACALAYFSGVHTQTGRQRTTAPIRGSSHFLARLDPKGFLVGLIFTATCALPVVWRLSKPWPLALVAAYFVLLAWLNCHAIESWESGIADSHILKASSLLSIAGLALAVAMALFHSGVAALLATGAASAILLALLDRLGHRLTPLALRIAADLVLLAPALVILLSFLFPFVS
jgi:hypothetical protein